MYWATNGHILMVNNKEHQTQAFRTWSEYLVSLIFMFTSEMLVIHGILEKPLRVQAETIISISPL